MVGNYKHWYKRSCRTYLVNQSVVALDPFNQRRFRFTGMVRHGHLNPGIRKIPDLCKSPKRHPANWRKSIPQVFGVPICKTGHAKLTITVENLDFLSRIWEGYMSSAMWWPVYCPETESRHLPDPSRGSLTKSKWFQLEHQNVLLPLGNVLVLASFQNTKVCIRICDYKRGKRSNLITNSLNM